MIDFSTFRKNWNAWRTGGTLCTEMISPAWEVGEFNFVYDNRRRSSNFANTRRRPSTSLDFYNIQFSYGLVSFSIFQSVVLQKAKHDIFAFIPHLLSPKHISLCRSCTILGDLFIHQSHCACYAVQVLMSTHLHPNVFLIHFIIKNSVGRFPPLSKTHPQYIHKPSGKFVYHFLHSVKWMGWRKLENDE